MTLARTGQDLLTGQVAVVTGSGSGIGSGIVEQLGRFGAAVVVADVDEGRALEESARLSALGIESMGLRHDVTDGEDGRRIASRIVDALGRVDLLVNNAGISGRVPLVEMDDRTWDAMIAVNLTGVQRTSRAFVEQMTKQGSGTIVSISSIAGRFGVPNMTHYCSTKWGVIGFTQALAKEVAPAGIRVNAVCPGIVRTQMWEVELAEISEARGISVDEAWQQTLDSIPLGRAQTPEDIGSAVAFLASPLAQNITGQSLNVDGGIAMS